MLTSRESIRSSVTCEESYFVSIGITRHRKFDHPNIVKILAVCVDNDPVYIIMELMPAGDLLKFLREAHPESVSYNIVMCSYGT